MLTYHWKLNHLTAEHNTPLKAGDTGTAMALFFYIYFITRDCPVLKILIFFVNNVHELDATFCTGMLNTLNISIKFQLMKCIQCHLCIYFSLFEDM